MAPLKRTLSPLGIPLGFLLLLFLAYARLILHPSLHTACPENDTWNLPVRWSVLAALREGRLPLWNPLSAFGIPWLATWQTETFYPGTLFFKWFGLPFWNFSGLIHLLIFAGGLYQLLRKLKIDRTWAFLSAAVGLLNGCAYNHLGSNSSMDTMAWMPWVFLATHWVLEREARARLLWTLFLALQVFAGYPQIILYTLAGALAYAVFKGGLHSLRAFAPPLAMALLLSACQWLPSAEYFLFNSVRLPAIHDNPRFYLPLENLKTFLDFSALSRKGVPDYVASPTYFYFNFFSGWIPLGLLGLGTLRLRRLKRPARFFLAGFLLTVLWAIGFFGRGFDSLGLPLPGFLEPAKSWVLINLFELIALGLILGDLFPRPGKWKWALLLACILNLLVPVFRHPLETNLLPPNPILEAKAKTFRSHRGSGRILILPNTATRAGLYTPFPGGKEPLFKRFVPNSNYFASLPLATFYGSTQPSWGALDAGFYFQYVFPQDSGALMDLLGVDLLYLPQDRLPPHYRKIMTDGQWTLWQNPGSVGSHFIFNGKAQTAARRSIFALFAGGKDSALRNLYLEPDPVSLPSLRRLLSPASPAWTYLPGQKAGYLIVTQNAEPGWRAWVDGNPTGIYLADGIFQGIPLPAGARRVHLSYEPASFRLGLFLSLLGLAGLGLWGGLRKRRWV